MCNDPFVPTTKAINVTTRAASITWQPKVILKCEIFIFYFLSYIIDAFFLIQVQVHNTWSRLVMISSQPRSSKFSVTRDDGQNWTLWCFSSILIRNSMIFVKLANLIRISFFIGLLLLMVVFDRPNLLMLLLGWPIILAGNNMKHG